MGKPHWRDATESRESKVPDASHPFAEIAHDPDEDDYLRDLQSSFLEVTGADQCVIKPAPDWRETVRRWLSPGNLEAVPVSWIRIRHEGAKSEVSVNLVLGGSPAAQIIVITNKKRGLGDILDNLTAFTPKVLSQLCLRGLREEANAYEWHRLAQDLHDGPLQIATAAKVRLQAFQQGLEHPAAAKGLDEAIALMGQVITEMRALLQNRVQPSGSDSLMDHLRQAAGRWGELTGMRVHFSFPEAPAGAAAFSRATLEIAEHVVRESIVNAWKHGKATQVSVSCEPHDGGVLLTLQDDGSGFRPTTAPEPQAGTRMGLRLLRSRVGELGGWFDVRSSHDGGAVVQAWLPPRPTSHREPE